MRVNFVYHSLLIVKVEYFFLNSIVLNYKIGDFPICIKKTLPNKVYGLKTTYDLVLFIVIVITTSSE